MHRRSGEKGAGAPAGGGGLDGRAAGGYHAPARDTPHTRRKVKAMDDDASPHKQQHGRPFPIRALWSWNPVGPIDPAHPRRRIFNYDDMHRPDKAARLVELAGLLRNMGATHLVLSGKYGEAGVPAGAPTDYVRSAYRDFCRWVGEETGARVVIFFMYNPTQDWGVPPREPACVFDLKWTDFWRRRADDLFGRIPNLGGYIMGGAGGLWQAPWECPCPRCAITPRRELLRRAVEMLSAPLAERDGLLLYKAVTDRPTMLGAEVEAFGNWRPGELPANAVILHKGFYKDFRPPHPPNALFYTQKPPRKDAPQSHYGIEAQIWGEYRGGTHWPCSMAHAWSPIFRRAADLGQRAALGIFHGNEHVWDHPLNMANWNAWGRLAADPYADPDAMLAQWATTTYPGANPGEVTTVLRDTYAASTGLQFSRGVLTQGHSYLPSINWELEPSLCGPWHSIPAAPPGHVGRGHDLSMYPPDVREALLADDSLLLFARRVPLTHALADALIAEKREAAALWKLLADRWRVLRASAGVAGSLDAAAADAKLWADSFALYIDYKAGRLGRSDAAQRLEAMERAYAPTAHTPLCSPEQMSRLLKEWEAVLGGTFRRRLFGDGGDAYEPGLPPGFAD